MNNISTPSEVVEGVRQDMSECLGLDLEEITTKSTFFSDLGGESIDVIDLMFRCEKRFGVRIELQSLMSDLQLGADGRLSDDSILQLQSKSPEINWQARVAAISTDDPRDILTVDLVCELVRVAIQSR